MLFIVFMAGMIVISIKAVQMGDKERLLRGQDMYGNLCGVKNTGKFRNNLDLRAKPVLVFPNPLRTGISYCAQHCPCSKDVPQCPVVDLSKAVLTTEESNSLLCLYDRDGRRHLFTGSDSSPFVADATPTIMDVVTNPSPFTTRKCYWWFETRRIMNRCLPSGQKFFVTEGANVTTEDPGRANAVNDLRDTTAKAMADVNVAKYWIIMLGGVALVLGFIWLILLTCFAGFFVWTAIVLIQLLFIAMTVFFGYQYREINKEQERLKAQGRSEDFTNTEKAQKTTLMVLAVVCGIASLIIFFLICFFFQRIQVAVRLIKEAAHAILEMPGIILFPFVPLVLLIGCMFWFVVIWLFLGTVGTEIGDSNGNFKGYRTDRTLQSMQIYFVFGFFWQIAFILAMMEMSFAFAFSRWYYAPTKEAAGKRSCTGSKSEAKDGVSSMTVWSGFGHVLFYHLGTVAFGSLIVAIVMAIRAAIWWLKKNLEKYRNNSFIQRILSCLSYCFLCVQRFIEFINRNAYIVTSMTGNLGFCGAAKRAYTLLTQNAFLLVAVSAVSEFLLLLGKLFIVLTCVGIAIFIFRDNETLNYWIIPVILVAILAYAIASCFMLIFSMATQTMFLCFCYDIEFATMLGKQGDWPHTSKELDGFIDKFRGPHPTLNAEGKVEMKK